MSSTNDPPFTTRMLAAVQKTRDRGIGWAASRVREEIRTPTSAASRLVRNVLAAGRRRRLMRHGSGNTLYFFYDLEIAPITYDFASYLTLAEMERRKRGLDDIHVVIVPGRRLEKEFDDYQDVVTPAMRAARVYDMLLPMTRLLPSCRGVTLCGSVGEAEAVFSGRAGHVWPDGYVPGFPTLPHHREVRERARAGEPVFPALRAPPVACDTVQRYLAARMDGALPVVISLREYGYNPGRNSRLAEWGEFARGLDGSRYQAVFVRDSATALDPLPPELEGQLAFAPASFDPALRMALYEAAFVNLAVMHGPMELCWYNERCAYGIMMEMGTAPQNTEAALTEQAFTIRGDLPFAAARQRWYWQPDTAEEIRRAFEDLCARAAFSQGDPTETIDE